MSLPAGLENEPYSYEDSGARLEIVVKRPKFHFEVTYEEISVSVDGVIIATDKYGCPNYDEELPQKCTSNVSLLTIYDTCGLEAVHLFVGEVLLRCRPTWAYVYLRGSYAALGLTHTEEIDTRTRWKGWEGGISYLYSLISAELTRRELGSVRLPYAIVPREVPEEVLALITNSQRLSKSISDYVEHARKGDSSIA
ncbi:Hypothetical protein POVR2_LOCUS36 [uncultured virus]|nr:Hypothetical protein POVR2_LOCUS36 [uncultured virus]